MTNDPFDALFGRRRYSRFSQGMDPNWVPQERPIGGDVIEAQGFIEDGAVDNAQLADGAITTTKITDGSISTPKLAANAVTIGKMAGSPRNLVTNPDFEIASPWGWTGAGARATNVTPPSGQYSLNETTAGSTVWNYSEQFPVFSGRRYYFSCWARGHTGNTSAFALMLRVRWFDSTGATISDTTIANQALGQTNAFTQLRGFAVAPATAAYAFVIGQHTSGASDTQAWSWWDMFECYEADQDISHAGGNVVIDSTGVTITNGALSVTNSHGEANVADGEVVQISGEAKNLIPNGGFELTDSSGNPLSWTLPSGATLRTDGNPTFTVGRNSLQFIMPSTGTNYYLFAPYVRVQAVRRYRVAYRYSGYASNSGGGTIQGFVEWYDGTYTTISTSAMAAVSIGTLQGLANYQYGPDSIQAPTGAVFARLRIRFNSSLPTGERVYIDEVELWLADQDIDHASGNVLIDSTGVTITNGALSVQSSSGKSVMTGGDLTDNSVMTSKMIGALDNLLTNPSWEKDGVMSGTPDSITGWYRKSGSNVSFGIQSTYVYQGSYALRILAVPGTAQQLAQSYIPATSGARYMMRAWVRGLGTNSSGCQAQVAVNWFDINKAYIVTTSTTVTIGASTTWTDVSTVQAAPAGAAYGIFYVGQSSAGASGDYMYFDSAEFYRVDNDVNHAAGNVVINSSGVAITNGALTVTNASSTVIIDGSSNMFKIAATGTLTKAWGGSGTSGSQTVTLTALGTMSTPLMVLWNITEDNAVGAGARETSTTWAPDGSYTMSRRAMVYTMLTGVAPAYMILTLYLQNRNSGSLGWTAAARYYALKEASI